MICSRDVSARWFCYLSKAPVVRLSREAAIKGRLSGLLFYPTVEVPGAGRGGEFEKL